MKAVKIGQIQLGNSVRVSDPCYDMNVWCAGTLENILKGVYNAYVKIQDNKDGWGRRITELSVCHSCHRFRSSKKEMVGSVGVDSGTCGIYDLEYYEEHHYDDSIDEEWYSKHVCESAFWKKPYQSSLLDGKGVMSCTGYGDGQYSVYVKKNEIGQIYQITIVYIYED